MTYCARCSQAAQPGGLLCRDCLDDSIAVATAKTTEVDDAADLHDAATRERLRSDADQAFEDADAAFARGWTDEGHALTAEGNDLLRQSYLPAVV